MNPGAVRIFGSPEEYGRAVVQEIIGTVNGAIAQRGSCLVALSGGETPRLIYSRLATHPDRERIDWNRVHLIFGDERMVPPDNSQSNFGMVERELLAQIPIPAGNVHRIRGERPPSVAAREYGEELKQLFASTNPCLDLVLLGVGEDGHTASLFPGTDVLDVIDEPVKDVFVSQFRAWRVTITLPVINNARQVIVLCTGRRKASIAGQILNAPEPTRDLPATLVRPVHGELLWMLDAEAAVAYVQH